MFKLLFYSCLTMLVVSCTDKTKTTSEASSTDTLHYAYTAGYSSKFELGKNDQAQKVLELWKQYDMNDFSKSAPYFADTVTINLSNGIVAHGQKDSVIAMVKGARSRFDSVRSEVDAWLPLHSIDKESYWVSVWGVEFDMKDAKRDTILITENWRFDKNGKIDFMEQYSAVPPKK
jgi:hypothetical protein